MDGNPRYFYKNYCKDDEKMEFFLTNIADDTWNAEQDRGRSLAERREIIFAEFPEYEEEIRADYDNWTVMLCSDIPKNVEVLRKLEKSRYELFGLTTWSSGNLSVCTG